MAKKYCKDCKIEISEGGTRCQSCAKKGERSHYYIDGRTLKKYYCVDCKEELKSYTAKRCRKCAYKEHSKKMKGHVGYWKGKKNPKLSEKIRGKPTWNKGKRGVYSKQTLMKLAEKKRKQTEEAENLLDNNYFIFPKGLCLFRSDIKWWY